MRNGSVVGGGALRSAATDPLLVNDWFRVDLAKAASVPALQEIYAALARNELHIRRAPTGLRRGQCFSFDEK